MILDGSNVNFLIAFLAGVVSFLAPCFLSIVILQITVGNRFRSFLFIFGFLLVFIGLGVAAGSLRFLAGSGYYIVKAGGVLLILIGLESLGVLRLGAISAGPARGLTPLLVGITFGFSWTACVGPILALILFWISQEATLAAGLTLLFFFCLGFVLPFLLLSFVFGRLLSYIYQIKRFGYLFQKLSAALAIIVGVLFLSGKFGYLIAWTLGLQNALF